jgi:hypothetical protein
MNANHGIETEPEIQPVHLIGEQNPEEKIRLLSSLARISED